MDACTPHIYGGQRNIIMFTDHFSGFKKAYLLFKKSGAPEALEKYLNFCRSHGVIVRRLHRDGAGEFFESSPPMRDVLKRHGLLGATTTLAANVHRQNGIAERANRTVQDGIRTRLIQANISLGFWWFALLDTLETDSYIPLRDSPMETPYSRFFGKPPSVTHVRVFGCLAYAKIFDPVTKLAERASPGVYLGRTPGYAAYVVRITNGGKLVTTPHAVFVKKAFPGIDARRGEPNIGAVNPLISDTPLADDAAAPGAADGPPPNLPVPMPTANFLPGIAPTSWPYSIGNEDSDIRGGAPGPDAPPPALELAPTNQRPRSGRGAAASSPTPAPRLAPTDAASEFDRLLESTYTPVDSDGGTGEDNDASSSAPSHISQRLSHRGHGISTAQLFSSFTATPVLSAPGGDFLIYVGCGMRRGTDFAMQLAAITNTVKVVLVDIAFGGAAHDLSREDAVSTLEAFAARPECIGVLASPPGYTTGESIDTHVSACLRVVRAGLAHGARFIVEHPVARAHLSLLWDAPCWKAFAQEKGCAYVDFDRCAFDTATPTTGTDTRNASDTTRLACDALARPMLKRLFDLRGCTRDHLHHETVRQHPSDSQPTVDSQSHSPELSRTLARVLLDAANTAYVSRAASALWDEPMAALVASVAARPTLHIVNLSVNGLDRLRPIALALLDGRFPTDRSVDDQLDNATGVAACEGAVHERTGCQGGAGALPDDNPAGVVQPLHCGVSFATARKTWLAPDLAARLSRTTGIASFADPFGHKMYESPFDSNAPVPIMATRDGDLPSFNEARKGINWIPWEDAMIKEIDGLNRSGPIAELVPEDSLPT